MAVTNYQGDARAYIENLVAACGAKFTRNMTTKNTHLIAATYPISYSAYVNRLVVKAEKNINTLMIGEWMLLITYGWKRLTQNGKFKVLQFHDTLISPYKPILLKLSTRLKFRKKAFKIFSIRKKMRMRMKMMR